ncbi:DUF7619 domain-containing protein [Neolewinella antarctica]|uniref:Repeat protein (TIGR01451 family) n=1 Tax=Neolewinella antarctica TaxID=442734 RepID=A0ABX0XCB8_9BACT|nr:SdrD B-like domain-containing protein [Neolewinella antarctica]NJC26832.1 putative repeat protein (TIGR01451 family) [Neolewinella antarctica]
MHQLLSLLILLFGFTITLSGQDLPYVLEVLDLNTTPARPGAMDQVVEGPKGTYFNHKISGPSGSALTTLLYFDGSLVKEIYKVTEPVRLLSANERGIYFFEDIKDAVFGRNLLFTNFTTGKTDTLSNTPLSNARTVPFGDKIYVFEDAIQLFSDEGVAVTIDASYGGCSCGVGTRRFLQVGDFLYYREELSYGVTDGTANSTKTVFQSTFINEVDELFEYNGLIIALGNRYLRSYDPLTGIETDLTNDVVAMPGTLSPTATATAAMTTNGLVFTANHEDTGRELFVTNGTKAGTQLLLEAAEGPANGISAQGISENGKLLIYGEPVDGSVNLYLTDGSQSGTYPVLNVAVSEFTDKKLSSVGLTNGNIIIASSAGGAVQSSSKVYSIDPSNRGALAKLITTLPFNIGQRKLSSVNNRLIVSTDFFGGDLLSIGTTPNDVFTVGENVDLTFLYENEDFLFYLDSRTTEQVIVATSGNEGDLTKLQVAESWASGGVDGTVFSIGDQLYSYAFDPEVGESVYSISAELGTTLVADFFNYTNGSDNINILPLGAEVVIGVSNRSSPAVSYLTSGVVGDIDTFSQAFGRSGFEELIGSFEDRFYFSDRFESTTYEFDKGDLESRPITQPSTQYTYSNPVLIADTLYRVRRARTGNFRYAPVQLSAFSVLDRVEKITAGDKFGIPSNGPISLVSDGKTLYYVAYSRAETQLRSYTIEGGEGKLLKSYTDNPNRINLYADDNQVVVGTISDLGLQYTFQSIANGNLGPEWDHTTDVYDIKALTGRTLLFDSAGRIFGAPATDLTKATLLLEDGPEAFFIQRMRNGEDRFVALLNNENNDTLKRVFYTDGTQQGSSIETDLSINTGDNILTFGQIGDFFALVTNNGNVILYNPVTNVQTVVPRSAGYSRSLSYSQVAFAGDKLFYVRRHPDYGAEVHVLSVAQLNYLRGVAYVDENKNGTRDEGEPGLAGVTINNGQGQLAISGAAGNFAFSAITDGSYRLTALNPECYELNSTPTSYSLSFDPTQYYDFAFGFKRVEGPSKLLVNLASGPTRCNSEVPFWLNVINSGCNSIDGRVQITLPANLAVVSSTVPYSSVGESILVFSLDSLQASERTSIRLVIQMPNEDDAGQVINIPTTATVDLPDGSLLTDTMNYSEIIRCAYDPNDKQVHPRRPEPTNSNYTQFDEPLRYTIRFQNTGNDTALTVRIADQLAENLNWETFKPRSASHSFTTTVSETGLVNFLFEDIQLPDSTTNPVESQGFVAFDVMANANSGDFTAVDNTAEIYFDFNRPIVTNTVTSTLVEKLDADSDGYNFYEDCDDLNSAISPAAEEIVGNDVDENCDGSIRAVNTINPLPGTLEVFPNPSRGPVLVKYSENLPLLLSVYSATGVEVIRAEFSGEYVLNLANYSSGSYLIRILDPLGRKAVNRWIQIQ